MIGRYSLPEMAAVWTESHRLDLWKEVETLALEAWAQLGVAPIGLAPVLRDVPTPTPEEVAEREKLTDHDVAAFVDVLSARIAPNGEWLHYGLTSSDVLDTASGAIMAEAATLLISATAELFAVVRKKAFEHRDTVMVGRTHGIWAEPTTFGLKVAGWAFEVARGHRRLVEARRTVSVGKISGAVGTYAHTPPSIEQHVCSQLGLIAEPASTQVTARDRHAEFLATIALVGACLERMATEIRHLQRSEVGEVREPFRPGQKGSSAMPHKRNPITAERICGMARLLRGYAVVGFENVSLWHERDISHSSAERVAVPDACLALHYMLVRMRQLIDGMVVDGRRMEANLSATSGLVYSQAVLLAMVAVGTARDTAYRIVQENALRAWDTGSQLYDLLADDDRVTLSPDDLKNCFEPQRFFSNSDVVYERLRDLELV